MSEHLDFDTDFLGKSTPTKYGGGSPRPGSPTKPRKWNPWLIGGGIVLGIIIIGAASDTSPSTPSTSPTSNNSAHSVPKSSADDVIVGRYRCSSYNSNRANDLKPDIPEATMKAQSNALDARIAMIKSEQTRIANMYVDDQDQDSIDNYNYYVDNYNSTKNRLNSDIEEYGAKLPHYNAQVDAFNNFLEKNCTPAY